MARAGDEPVLDERAHRLWQVPEALLVEVREDALACPGEQLGRDHRKPRGAAPLVQLAAHEAQDGGVDLQGLDRLLCLVPGAGLPRDIADDVGRDLPAHPIGGGLHDRQEGVAAVEVRKPHAIAPQGRDRAAQGLEIGEVILAQADDDPVVLLLVAEGERLAARLDARPHRGRDVVLDEVGELGDEGSDAAIPLPQGEQLLELIENQDRREEAVAHAPEMGRVEVFPETLLGAGRRGLDTLRRDYLDDRGLDLDPARRRARRNPVAPGSAGDRPPGAWGRPRRARARSCRARSDRRAP